jgi:hypothetical protein
MRQFALMQPNIRTAQVQCPPNEVTFVGIQNCPGIPMTPWDGGGMQPDMSWY